MLMSKLNDVARSNTLRIFSCISICIANATARWRSYKKYDKVRELKQKKTFRSPALAHRNFQVRLFTVIIICIVSGRFVFTL